LAFLTFMGTVSPTLSKLGQDMVARMAQEVVAGANIVRLQLLASHFYEAVKAELDRTPRHDPTKVGALAAAADQCRRSAEARLSPHLMLVELRAAVAMLTDGPAHRPNAAAFPSRPQLRVIQGGRA
jgi:hypothetical protein